MNQELFRKQKHADEEKYVEFYRMKKKMLKIGHFNFDPFKENISNILLSIGHCMRPIYMLH